MSSESEDVKILGIKISKALLTLLTKIFTIGVAIGAITAIVWFIKNT